MNRDEMAGRARERKGPWDMLVIGGGATGVGIALDAAARGYAVLLLEQSDFGKGSSTRSTKLIHGGVRYLQQGNISLVMGALKERGILREIAPHLVRDLAFVVPNYDWWEAPFYGIGLKVYDLLAGRYGFGPSKLLSAQATVQRIPTIKTKGLLGGVIYYDGQFDDARLLVNMAQTAAEQGAVLMNYTRVVSLTKDSAGYLNGAVCRDEESGEEHTIRAKVVINATGPFADAVRRLDDPQAAPMIAPSQGVHIVLEAAFLPGDSAIMVPRTSDGRVLFAIPYLGSVLVGTTDTPIAESTLEPGYFEEEIDFLLETAGEYLYKAPRREDIRSAFTGIRPLVKAGEAKNTSALSRDHTIHISGSGLLTMAGGKWTTYRHMAEDCVDHAETLAGLDPRPCQTKELRIHGYTEQSGSFDGLALYGSDAAAIKELARRDSTLAETIHPGLTICGAEVVWAARYEMARTVDDALARRTRSLLLNAKAAVGAAPRVASLLARELGRGSAWEKEQIETFQKIAARYMVQ